MSTPLYLYFSHTFMGMLIRKDQSIVFTPAENWSGSVEDGSFLNNAREMSVYDFFDNALPEGNRRAFYAMAHKIGDNDVFTFLQKYGEDLAGAYSVSTKKHMSTSLLKNITKNITKRIAAYESLNLVTQEKMSLNGFDNKTTVFIKGSQLYAPNGNFPSTHIIKASRDLSANEFFVTSLAGSCGIITNTPDLQNFGGGEALVSKRYDRYVDNEGRVQKIQQKDFCQYLDRPADDKYCNGQKGISNKDIAGILQDLSSEDRLRFLQAVAFSLLVGNSDDHAKNYSIVYSHGQKRLAPMYDLVSIFGAKRLTEQWSKIDPRLSRPFGQCLDPYKIKPKNFLLYAKDMQIDITEYMNLFLSMAKTIKEQLPLVEKIYIAIIKEKEFSLNTEKRLIEMGKGLTLLIDKRISFFVNIAEKVTKTVDNIVEKPAKKKMIRVRF